MTQFISGNALSRLPIDNEDFSGNDSAYPLLRWKLFQSSIYLNKLVRNEVGTKPLKRGDIQVEIGYVKIALQCLSWLSDDYSVEFGVLNEKDVIFDQELENNLIDFQTTFQVFNNGQADGVITANVISALDKKLFNLQAKVKLTRTPDGTILINILTGDEAELNIDDNLQIEIIRGVTTETINVRPGAAFTPLSQNDDGKVYVKGNEILMKEVPLDLQKPDQGFDKNVFKIRPEYISINGEQVENPQQLFDIQSKTPPVILSNGNCTVHTVQAGETAVGIIQQYYYGSNNTPAIKNPYDDSPIYQFPELTMSPISERGEDARLKFYLRFNHFFNTKMYPDGTVTEYGLTKDPNFVIDEDFLSDYNLYESGYTTANPDSVYPNYYRMLVAEEQNNSNSQITFDSNGESETFTAIPGEKIVIPDRKIIDALYYDINFRHQDWTVPTGNVMDYIPDIQSFINDIKSGSLWNGFTTWFQNETEQLYREAFEFMGKMYGFAIGALSNNWWRGAGGEVSGKIGVTWGYPIYTDFEAEKLVYRKMTPLDECVIMVKEEGSIGVGVDTGVGGSIGLFSAGKGRKRKKMGIGAEASVSAVVKINITNEYEFPVRKEETALLACLVTFTPSLVRQSTEILAMFNLVNFNPRSYLAKSSVEVGIEAQGDVTLGSNLGVQHDDLQNGTPQSKSLSVVDIFSKIPSINAAGGLYGGVGFVWEGKYADNPYVPETDRREPSEVSFEINFTAKGSLDFNTISGDFLKDILINTSLDALFTGISFDEGFTVGAVFKYERQVAAGQVTENYVNLNQHLTNAQPGDLGENNDGMMTIAGTPWQILIQFGTFSGNVEEIAVKGTESFLIINPYGLYQLAQQANSGTFNFDLNTLSAIIGVFHSYRSRYKMGLSTSGQRKPIAANVLNALSTAAAFDDTLKKLINRAGSLKDILEKNPNLELLLQGGFAVEVGYEIVFEDVSNLIGYVFKRLYGIFYLKYLIGDLELTIDFSNDLTAERKEFRKNWIVINKNSDGEYDKNQLYIATNAHMNTWIDGLYEPAEYDISTIDFKSSFEIFSSLYTVLKRYLVHTNSKTEQEEGGVEYTTNTKVSVAGIETPFIEDLELTDYLLPAMVSVARIANLDTAVEAKLGAGLGGELVANLLLKIRLELEGSAALIYRAQFYEKGNPLNLDAQNDPYYELFERIKKWFQTDLAETANLNNDRLRGSIVPIV